MEPGSDCGDGARTPSPFEYDDGDGDDGGGTAVGYAADADADAAADAGDDLGDDPAVAALQRVEWQLHDGGVWAPVPHAGVVRLRAAVVAGAAVCRYTLGSILSFAVDMASLVQTNVVTGSTAKLRVVPAAVAAVVPADPTPADLCGVVELVGPCDGRGLDVAAVTRWRVLDPAGPEAAAARAGDATCCVCQEALFSADGAQVVQLSRCVNHAYHAPCITAAFAVKPKCPWCGHVYAPMMGTQPNGTMRVRVDRDVVLAGHPDAQGAIVLQYDIPDGVQEARHPHPGKRFVGAHWTAYLPNSPRGRRVCEGLRAAFLARLVFHVGWSVTRAQDDCVAWATIHHKTSSGPGAFGYPDPGYLDRVTDELAQKGLGPGSAPAPVDCVATLLRLAADRRALVAAVEAS